MKKRLVSLFAITSVLFSFSSFAEEEKDSNTIIYLKSGSVISGKIIERTNASIKVKLNNLEELRVPLSEVESILNDKKDDKTDKSQKIKELEQEKEKLQKVKKEISQVIKLEEKISDSKKTIEKLEKGKKEDWFENPNYTRLFFAPTAKTLKKGEGYLQDINIFAVSANYGVTDNFSLGGLASLLPGVNTDQQILAFTPKFGTELAKDLNLGGGLLYVSGAGLAQVGVAYGICTYGSKDSNISLGVGGAYGNISKVGFFPKVGEQAIVKGSSALVTMAGAMHRIGENVSLVSENWIVSNTVSKDPSYLFSYGFRFFWENSSWDVAVMYPIIATMPTVPQPGIEYVWHF